MGQKKRYSYDGRHGLSGSFRAHVEHPVFVSGKYKVPTEEEKGFLKFSAWLNKAAEKAGIKF